jgi:uncharacterized membrane protein YdbT with pleckstrin-like domain
MLVRGLLVIRSSWVVAAPLVLLLTNTSGGTRVFLVVFAGYFAYTRLWRVFFDWAAVRYSASRLVLRVRSGLVSRTERVIPWDSVTAVAVRDDVPFRVTGVREFRFSVAALEQQYVELAGVSVRESERLLRLYELSRASGGTAAVRSAQDGSRVAPAAVPTLAPPPRVLDHLLIGLHSGRFLLVIPAAAGAVQMLGHSSVGSPQPIGLWSAHTASGSDFLLLAVAGGVAAAVFGTASSWMRYARFSVYLVDGLLRFRAGLMRREYRETPFDAIAAISMTQSPTTGAFGRVQLRFISATESGSTTNGMLMPSARSEDALRVVRRLSGVECLAARRRLPRILALTALVLVSLLGMWLVQRASYTDAANVLVGAGTVAFAALGVDRSAGHGHHWSGPEREWLVVHRGWWQMRDWVIRAAAIDHVTSRQLVGVSAVMTTISVRGSRAKRITFVERATRGARHPEWTGDATSRKEYSWIQPQR